MGVMMWNPTTGGVSASFATMGDLRGDGLVR